MGLGASAIAAQSTSERPAHSPINIVDDTNVVRERYSVVYGARIRVRDGQPVEKG